ncbi:MAG: hypothetical protein Q9168_007293 [Polycauliona sp. 1 TL-2023]
MSFAETTTEPFFAPSNFAMDYEDLLPRSQETNSPPFRTFQPWNEQKGQSASTTRNNSMAASWSMQDAFPPDTNMFSDSMKPQIGNLQNQNMPVSNPLIFPEGSWEAMETLDFSSLQNWRSSPQATRGGPTRQTLAPSSLDFPTSPPNMPSATGTIHPFAVVTSTSNAQPESTTHAHAHHHPPPINTPEETCSNGGPQNCLSAALEFLKTLHIPPSNCLSSLPPSSPPHNNNARKTDSVLATNRTGIELISRLSTCSCASSSQLQLILVVICDKLVAWYRAMLHSFPSTSNAQGPAADASQNLDFRPAEPRAAALEEEAATERVLHQRFAVGNCSFGAALERRIFGQVVAAELQRLEGVVRDLDARSALLRNNGSCINGQDLFLGQRGESSMEEADEGGFGRTVCRRLTAHLLQKVGGLREEMEMEGDG